MTRNTKLESQFYSDVLDPELRLRYPGCFIYVMDPAQLQGIPDRLVLFGSHWALLETKRATKSARRPNQEFRVAEFNEMSFSAFVHPGNYLEVLAELDKVFYP